MNQENELHIKSVLGLDESSSSDSEIEEPAVKKRRGLVVVETTTKTDAIFYTEKTAIPAIDKILATDSTNDDKIHAITKIVRQLTDLRSTTYVQLGKEEVFV